MMRAALAFAATLILATSAAETWIDHNDAHAVVGRPLTPVSYAGVARRTTRRTAAVAATAPVATAGVVRALPAGCVLAGGVYACGAVRYRPYYDGPSVVYQVVQ